MGSQLSTTQSAPRLARPVRAIDVKTDSFPDNNGKIKAELTEGGRVVAEIHIGTGTASVDYFRAGTSKPILKVGEVKGGNQVPARVLEYDGSQSATINLYMKFGSDTIAVEIAASDLTVSFAAAQTEAGECKEDAWGPAFVADGMATAAATSVGVPLGAGEGVVASLASDDFVSQMWKISAVIRKNKVYLFNSGFPAGKAKPKLKDFDESKLIGVFTPTGGAHSTTGSQFSASPSGVIHLSEQLFPRTSSSIAEAEAAAAAHDGSIRAVAATPFSSATAEERAIHMIFVAFWEKLRKHPHARWGG